MGGGEVARYMSRHAGRGVSSAILIASVVPYMLKTADNPDGVDQSIFDAAAAGIAADRAKFWAGFFKSFYGVGMLAQPVSDEVVEWSCDLAMRASLKATLDCAAAFSSTDFRGRSAGVPRAHARHSRYGRSDRTDRRLRPQGREGHRRQQVGRVPNGGPHGLLASHKDRIAKDVVGFKVGSMVHVVHVVHEVLVHEANGFRLATLRFGAAVMNRTREP